MPNPDLPALTERLRSFAAAREWEPFHTPKNLAMAVSVEAAELMEVFQWLTPEESADVAADAEALAAVSGEMADVAIYLIRLADVLGVDLAEAVERKIERNEERFPVDAVRGRAGLPPTP